MKFKLSNTTLAIIAVLSPNIIYAQSTSVDNDKLDTIEVQSTRTAFDKVQSLGQNFNKNLYPQQINTFNQKSLKNLQAKTLFEVVKQDASVNNNYTPLGYQENYSIRGSNLNLDSSYLINGIPATHRQIPNLANKEAVEVSKGINSLQSSSSNGNGTINYITKRAKNVQNISTNFETLGSYGISADIGSLKQDKAFGYRLNLAYDKLKPYIKTANGHKYLTSLALDGSANKLSWQFDADYQDHKQYTVPGIQLLDNSVIPIVSNDIMLNNSAWRKPVQTKAYNLGTRLKYDLTNKSNLSSSMQYSRTKINDNVAFPYNFQSNGDYRLADYQSPDQTYINKYIDLAFNTQFNTKAIKHRLTIGTSYLGFNKKNKDSISYAKETRNIYEPSIVINPYTLTGETLGDTYTSLKHSQKTLFLRDTLTYKKYQLFLGTRFTKLDEKAYNSSNQLLDKVNKTVFLPNIGLVYAVNDNFGIYTSYAKNLEIGRDADVIGYNSSYLPAKKSRQIEVGFNYKKANNKIQGAYFTTKKPFEYVDNNYQYVQQGSEKRNGLELNLITTQNATTFGLSTAYYLKATQEGTLMSSYNGADAVNVPKFKSKLWFEYELQNAKGTFIGANWNHESSKSVLKDASVKIPSYNTIDASVRYAKTVGKNIYNLRVGVDNILNKKYFKDAGEAYGENYIHFGAPRVYKASLSVDF